MRYYHVWVRSARFHGKEPLTYSYAGNNLAIGSVVTVPLRSQQGVLGIVTATVPKPAFATKSILKARTDLPPLPQTVLALAAWIRTFYPAPLGIITSLLLPVALPQTVLTTDESAISRLDIPSRPPLTAEQQQALAAIQEPETYILHGRTGSGKTRIYVELVERVVKQGRSAIILTPEIGLTSQLAATLTQTFGLQAVVLHSRLTTKERQGVWIRILSASRPLIVVGPRSALFVPLSNVGLIILDEAHDQAYKQEQAPRYHSLRVAAQLRRLHSGQLVVGSATPNVTEYYLARQKQKPIIRLSHLAKSQRFGYSIQIIDLKDRGQFNRAAHISQPLIDSIAQSLSQGEQTLLYLNRRGTARVALCEHCSWQAICSHCDIPLTYHGDEHALRCHICTHRQQATTNCPSCGHSITFHSFGTKAIVDEVARLFPEARVMRFDTDNQQPERLEAQYASLIRGEVDVLVGTQMLAKGLDLPLLSTLGVIAADSSLYLPDYTAHERTYQLLSQVIGRIGRGHVAARAVVQTYHPESHLLTNALHDNWRAFYDSEIEDRRKYFFPPFCHLLKLQISRSSAANAEKTAQLFSRTISEQQPAAYVEGPAPAFHERAGKAYRWQLIVKARERKTLLSVVAMLPTSGWTYDLDPADLL